MVLSSTRKNLVQDVLSILFKLKIVYFFKGIGALVDMWCSWLRLVWEVSCVLPFHQPRTFTRHFNMCPHVLTVLNMRAIAFWCRLHCVVPATQLRFTFLTSFLMFKSFLWPAPHISCLAVYSWSLWVLLWQRFLWSSAWHWAQVDYSNRPCYWVLLFSIIVTATEDPLKKYLGMAKYWPFECACRLTVLVIAHGEVVWFVWQFITSLVQANGHSREPRHHKSVDVL